VSVRAAEGDIMAAGSHLPSARNCQRQGSTVVFPATAPVLSTGESLSSYTGTLPAHSRSIRYHRLCKGKTGCTSSGPSMDNIVRAQELPAS